MDKKLRINPRIVSARLITGFLILFICLSSGNAFALPKPSELLVFESSNLPIIVINTSGQTITNNNSIIAKMGIINKGPGIRNFLTDPFTDYNGLIEIEIRGHSSAAFDQKSYRLETHDASGLSSNVPLLGMPQDNDWVLYGPYCDKSLIRNALVYQLAGEINPYAPRTRFCELMMNNSYKGVYLLIEKIKQDKNRVNITKLTPFDIAEPWVSGGYMFKKELSSDVGDNVITLSSGLVLSVVEPKPENILSTQTKWLTDYLNTFEAALFRNVGDYHTFIDVQSMVDNFIMVELTKNVDGFRASTYFYKDRAGKITAGPVWDYNLSLGNADYNYGWTPERWYHEDESAWFYWFDKLLTKADFWDLIRARWAELRGSVLELNRINLMIDSMVSELDEAQTRHFTKWNILGHYTWPNPGYPQSGEWGFPSPTSGAPTTWTGEIDIVKDFVRERLVWMDIKLDYQPNLVYQGTTTYYSGLQIYPNPCYASARIEYKLSKPGQVIITMYNLNGQEIKMLQTEHPDPGMHFQMLDVRDVQNGIYLVKFQIEDRIETLKLIVGR
jgi:hypothetical protein